MTTPRDDIAGLSERLRDQTRHWTGIMSRHPAFLDPELSITMMEAATQLDSLLKERDALQARVKELDGRYLSAVAARGMLRDRADEAESRALRAEQERDEAVAVLNPFMPDPTMMDLLWGDMDDEATGSHTIKLKHFRAARDLVRRLAGPEKA